MKQILAYMVIILTLATVHVRATDFPFIESPNKIYCLKNIEVENDKSEIWLSWIDLDFDANEVSREKLESLCQSDYELEYSNPSPRCSRTINCNFQGNPGRLCKNPYNVFYCHPAIYLHQVSRGLREAIKKEWYK